MTTHGEYSFHLEHVSIPKKIYDKMCINHPILRTKESHRRFLALIVGDKLHYGKSGRPMIPYYVLAFCEDKVSQCKSNNYHRTKQFLYELKRETFYDLQWTDYSEAKKQCRELEDTGLLTLLEEVANNDNEIAKEVRVYIMSGQKVTHRQQASDCEKERNKYKSIVWKYEDQKKIAGYLHDLPLSLFSSLVDGHYDAIDEFAKCEEDKDTRSYLASALNGIASMPMPFYAPSENQLSMCPRLFGSSFATLKKDYRRMFTGDVWIDLDLSNCQLAIASALFKIDSIQALLQTGVKIWPELMEWLGIPIDRRTDKVKKIVKQALYSIIYGKKTNDSFIKGKHIVGVDSVLEQGLIELGITITHKFSEHSLMHDLVVAIRKAKHTIEKEHGCTGAYDWMVKPHSLDMDSFISYAIQTYELKMIATCYDVAINEKRNCHKTFEICLHQHDGFSFKPAPGADKDKVIAKLQDAVQTVASQYHIITTLTE